MIMDDEITRDLDWLRAPIPRQYVYERLAGLARYGWPDEEVSVRAFGAVLRCRKCRGFDPDATEDPDRGWWSKVGEVWPWEECDGFIRIGPPAEEVPRGANGTNWRLAPVGDILRTLDAWVCCHEEADAIDGWDWVRELTEALQADLAVDDDLEVDEHGQRWGFHDPRPRPNHWRKQYLRQTERAATEAVHRDARRRVVEAASLLSHHERVQAAGAALMSQHLEGVRADQARLSWECGHTTATGDWSQVVVMVRDDGTLTPLRDIPGACEREHPGQPSLASPAVLVALGDEYARVAMMSPEERATYRPVKQARQATSRGWGGGGRRGGGGGRATARKPPEAGWTVPQAVTWLDGLTAADGSPLVPPSTAQTAAWLLVKDLDGHPGQDVIREAQKTRKAGVSR